MLDTQQSTRQIDSDVIADRYRFNLPQIVFSGLTGIFGTKVLGYLMVCHPALTFPLLIIPGSVATVMSLITGVKIWDNHRRGETPIGVSEANAIVMLTLVFTLPFVAWTLQSRLAPAQPYVQASQPIQK